MNCSILAIVLLVNMSYASPAKDPPKQLACKKACKDDYTPLCGKPVDGKGTDITFGNNCVLDNYNCEKADKREFIDHKNYYFITNNIFHLPIAYEKSAAGECPGKAPVRL